MRAPTILAAVAASLTLSIAFAQVPPSQKAANKKYIKGVTSYMGAQQASDPEKRSGLFEDAFDNLTEAHLALLAEVHQYQLMRALVMVEQDRVDEAVALFDDLRDSPNETVRTRATEEHHRLLKSLGESEWATIRFECGALKAKIKLTPTDVVEGTSQTLSDLLGKWVSCDRWDALHVVRPGSYGVQMMREPDGEDEPFIVSDTLELGIGDRRDIKVHFALAPAPPITIVCTGCGSGPDCRVQGRGQQQDNEDRPRR